jgi:hypothetical protein
MAQNQTTFSDRVQRIEGDGTSRLGRRRDAFVVRIMVSSFILTALFKPSQHRPRRLRFGFPIKGVIFASILAILVKGYLIWTLGDDVYGAAVAQLLSGNQFERAAGLILAPDAVSLWIVDAYQQIYRFIVSVATALETGTFPESCVIWCPVGQQRPVFHEERALRIISEAPLFHSGEGPCGPAVIRDGQPRYRRYRRGSGPDRQVHDPKASRAPCA